MQNITRAQNKIEIAIHEKGKHYCDVKRHGNMVTSYHDITKTSQSSETNKWKNTVKGVSKYHGADKKEKDGLKSKQQERER